MEGVARNRNPFFFGAIVDNRRLAGHESLPQSSEPGQGPPYANRRIQQGDQRGQGKNDWAGLHAGEIPPPFERCKQHDKQGEHQRLFKSRVKKVLAFFGNGLPGSRSGLSFSGERVLVGMGDFSSRTCTLLKIANVRAVTVAGHPGPTWFGSRTVGSDHRPVPDSKDAREGAAA